MKTIFENNDFALHLTGHYFDFVGIIETKTEAPLTFYFSEEGVELEDEDGTTYDEWEPDEDKTRLLGVHKGLREYDCECDDPEDDEEQNLLDDYRMKYPEADSIDYFRTRDDGSTGFLSDPRERGFFLALVKAYCPEALKEIEWAA